MPVSTMETPTEEHVVMSPKFKDATTTIIVIERQRQIISPNAGNNNSVHVGDGPHKGIVINKVIKNDDDNVPSQLSLEFKVFLVNASTSKHALESRTLEFWFKPDYPESEYARHAQELFKELVSPADFPRDYVGFIKKMMKLLQKEQFGSMKKIELKMKQLGETDKPPERPLSADETNGGAKIEVTEPKILEMIESAYPNPLTIQDISRQVQSEEDEIKPFLNLLKTKGLIKCLENNAFTRVVQNETTVKIVRQMPKMVKAKQPTIAIITAQYCEKVAVDAMIENQETFVRYTTVGESNVYTLGNIGAHRVVSTKLPSVGHTREAMIAAGNTTTRLLGTFQKVDYVFLIGVGGGVPHFTDFNKHVRLGDIVVSTSTENQKHLYVFCEKENDRGDGTFDIETKGWHPTSTILQEIATAIQDEGDDEWVQFVEEGKDLLIKQEADFGRPDPSTDKLYMAIGEKEVIEVSHPNPSASPLKRPSKKTETRVHFGTVGSGRYVSRDDHARQEMSCNYGILAYDSEFDPVVESIIGNRRDAFIVIRGISDYKDGTRRREWQPHAALLAAAFGKAIICRMDPPADD